MKHKARGDRQLQYEYGKLKKNAINDFHNTLSNEEKSQYGEKYIKLCSEMHKNYTEEFDIFPNAWEQFELHNGIARFKPESDLIDDDFGMMIQRAIYVNKKIRTSANASIPQNKYINTKNLCIYTPSYKCINTPIIKYK